MIGAENDATANAQALHRRDVLNRVDLILHLAGPHVVGADVLVDQFVLSGKQSTTLERGRVAGVTGDTGEHVQLNLQRQHTSIAIFVHLPLWE
jgi:hypothetical protein